MFNWLLKISRMPFFFLGSIGFLGLSVLSGCDPCHQLADAICSCEVSSLAQDSCRKSISIRSSYRDFDFARDEETCKRVLDSKSGCDCQAIANHEYGKCGMTRQSQ